PMAVQPARDRRKKSWPRPGSCLSCFCVFCRCVVAPADAPGIGGTCRRIEPLSAAFIVAGLGFLVAALLQQKGWPYQLLPAALFCVAAAVVQLANAPRWRIPMALAIGLAVLLPVLSNLRDNLDANG